ncbi:MAG: hypothetical protein AAFZ15_17525, partial [Bacteroidota bacterium]
MERPKWLKRLERESWQAELIVSGAAIFGSLQLPGLLKNLIELSLIWIPESIHLGVYMLFIYLFFAADVLIVCLIVHFVARSLWIGFIGLNSVFPKGIIPQSNTYSAHFMEQVIKDFPHDMRHITDLDKFCSVIFALCAYLIMTFMAITIDIFVLLIIFFAFSEFLPENYAFVTLVLFIVLITLASCTTLVMNSKMLREKTWVKKYHYRFYTVTTKIALNIFRKPIGRLSFTFMSNLKMKNFVG